MAESDQVSEQSCGSSSSNGTVCNMENNSQKKPTLSFTFPEDLIAEILLRLPVRSLLRFKCVCKTWLTLISDAQFANSHFALAASPTHRILHAPTKSSIESVDIEAPHHDHSSPLLGCGNLRILGACRGLVLFHGSSGDLIIWNPATSLHKQITRFKPNSLNYHGFEYDTSTDDYFIVFMALHLQFTQFLFFSFKTNSWNNVHFQDDNFLYHSIGNLFAAGSFVNGAIHWLVITRNSKLLVVVGFHWIDRSLYEIPLPLDITNHSCYWRLRAMGGCLALCFPGVRKGDAVEIWVMKEYRVSSSWTKTFVVPTCPEIPYKSLSPICFANGGGILGLCSYKKSLVKLDDKGELVEVLRLKRVMVWEEDYIPLYRESLLPLPTLGK